LLDKAMTNYDSSDAVRGDIVGQQGATLLPSDVLDLEGLRNRCMGNLDLVQRVLKMFCQRIPEEMGTMEKALELKDTEQIARVAHRVKGSSASVSADGVARAAAEIEEVSRAGRMTDISASIGRLHDEWDKCSDYATTLLSLADTA
jgi:HPt (histidine-containing phosphotransfer) domain-containing protein